tara:strand:- start:158 stop:583 length:426 start_codon:yes stop_codon:yes gene_type:complete
MLNKLTTLQVIENKLSEGYETMYLYIEDSDCYDTVTVNIRELLQTIAVGDEYIVNDDYTIYGLGINTDRDGNKLGLCKGDLFSNAAMLNVFTEENECFDFCVNYLINYDEDGEDCVLTKLEAEREVAQNSNGSWNFSDRES